MYKYSLDVLSSSDLQNFLNKNILIITIHLGEFVITIGAGWLDSSGQISTHQSWIVYGSTSTDDCENACKIISGCVGFTFVSTIERCDLKDIQQAVTLISQPEAIISGILGNLFSMCIGMTRYDMTIIVSR